MRPKYLTLRQTQSTIGTQWLAPRKLVSFFFCFQKRFITIQHTVDNKVSTLARLTLYESLFIEQKKSVRSPHKRVEFRQNARAFFARGQRKLSVITRFPY